MSTQTTYHWNTLEDIADKGRTVVFTGKAKENHRGRIYYQVRFTHKIGHASFLEWLPAELINPELLPKGVEIVSV